ncbi:MAG: DNA polymerase I [Bacteroidaceae bacterium]|nr:DNA polymerase I [Bacteroidaceae bacterium]
MKAMDKLFLLDAYALIYRAYYAMIKMPRVNSKGQNTSAILGFLNTLDEILAKENPTHIGVAFDPKGGSFRNELYAEYKAQREETPEDIKTAVPIIKRLLKAYNIPVLEVPGFEADDVIGTLSAKAGAAGIDTFMLTPDKDYCQLVTDKVSIYRPRHGGGYEVMKPADVLEKYGITDTKQIIDMLGLMGDSADNIPGCPGVGPKGALKLIEQFGSIDNLLDNTDQLKGAMKDKIENNKEGIRFSKLLATIRTDVPIELDMQALKREEPDLKELAGIFKELEFRSHLNRLAKTKVGNEEETAVKKEQQPASVKNDGFAGGLFEDFTGNWPEKSENSILRGSETAVPTYELIDNEHDVVKIETKIPVQKKIALFVDCSGNGPMTAKLNGLAIAVADGSVFYVNQASAVKSLLEDESIAKVGHNMKYDLTVLERSGITLKGELHDNMVAHYLIQPEQHHEIEYLAEVYLKESLPSRQSTDQRSYSCLMAVTALRLETILTEELKKDGTLQVFHDIEMPLTRVLAYMERNGARVDTDGLKETSRLFTERMKEIEQQVFEDAGCTFNLDSPRQVGQVLFEKMMIVEKAKKTKTGQYVTSEEVLESLRGKHPIVGKILQYRGLRKLVSTYVDSLPSLINPETGKIHTSFNQTITATGRLSSSNPNLQNIPIRDENGKEVRKAFIPEPGCKFFSADYSQIELRIMAHLSGDRNMIEDFTLGHDVHAATAAKVFHKPIEEVTKTERSKAKTANFGIIYGISVFGLAERMQVSRAEAKELIENYFKTYSGIQDFMEKQKADAREKGYIETILHRKRYLPDINSHNAVVRGYAERNAINAPIQGSASDIIKIAMTRIYERFMKLNLKSTMILQVHDELNFNVVPGEEETVQSIVLEEMQSAYSMSVPLVADCGWGSNWLEAH